MFDRPTVPITVLPKPDAFPVGSMVKAGPYRGEVIELRGPYSVTIRDQQGRKVTISTTEVEIDPDAKPIVPPVEPAQPADLFSFI